MHDSYRQKFTKLSNQFNNDVLVNIAGNFLGMNCYSQRRKHDADDSSQNGVWMTGTEQAVGVKHPRHKLLKGPHD